MLAPVLRECVRRWNRCRKAKSHREGGFFVQAPGARGYVLVALQGLTPSRPIQRKNLLVINDLESLPGIQQLREMDPGSGPPRSDRSCILIEPFWVRRSPSCRECLLSLEAVLVVEQAWPVAVPTAHAGRGGLCLLVQLVAATAFERLVALGDVRVFVLRCGVLQIIGAS